MSEFIMYVGIMGIFIGYGMILAPMVFQRMGKQWKQSDSCIKIGFIIFCIFSFVAIGGAFGISELGKIISAPMVLGRPD